MGNFLFPNYITRVYKNDNYDTIVFIGQIVTGITSLVYIPILFVFFSSKFTRIKVIQLELLISGIFHNITFIVKGQST